MLRAAARDGMRRPAFYRVEGGEAEMKGAEDTGEFTLLNGTNEIKGCFGTLKPCNST